MSFNFGGNNANSGDKKPFSFGNTSTPGPSAPTNVFGGMSTTTPAGPPPAKTGFSFGTDNSIKGSGAGLFGAASKAENRPMFGTPASTTENKSAASPFSFGGTNTTATSTTAQAPAQNTENKGFSFGSSTPAQTPAQNKPSGGFSFGGNATGSTSTVADASKAIDKPAGGFSFGNAGASTSTPAATSSPFSFGTSKPAEQTKPAAATPSASSGGFSFGKTDSAAVEKTETAKPAAGGFTFGSTPAPAPAAKSTQEAPKASGGFSFGTTKPEEKKEAGNATTSMPATSTPGGFQFGNAKPEEKKEAGPTAAGFAFGATKTEDKKDGPAVADTTSKPTFGASTLGANAAAPAPPSLKNKTMEDIINKWSADLDKYSQDFQKQARQIADWDKSLLTSGDQISRLYSATVEAEQQSGKVDQALNYIENQQDELSQLLDSYESQVRDITTEVGVTQPADQEREQAYGQAERLVSELNGMGKNLSQMVSELNKSGEVMSRLKEDDPLSSIVKILNSQLQSLNWIDENATKLNEKVDQLTSMHNTESPQTPNNKFRFGSLRLD